MNKLTAESQNSGTKFSLAQTGKHKGHMRHLIIVMFRTSESRYQVSLCYGQVDNIYRTILSLKHFCIISVAMENFSLPEVFVAFKAFL